MSPAAFKIFFFIIFFSVVVVFFFCFHGPNPTPICLSFAISFLFSLLIFAVLQISLFLSFFFWGGCFTTYRLLLSSLQNPSYSLCPTSLQNAVHRPLYLSISLHTSLFYLFTYLFLPSSVIFLSLLLQLFCTRKGDNTEQHRIMTPVHGKNTLLSMSPPDGRLFLSPKTYILSRTI